jgi:hypothetical protein
MARPASSTPNDVRTAVLGLLREAAIAGSPSSQSFRRAVSVRKVRERLGGGNMATIGREINRLEAEIVVDDQALLGMPEIPPDIAALMSQLWQAAVGVQLDSVVKLQTDAKAVAHNARSELTEAQLRTQVLLQELAEMRAAAADKDTKLAEALAAQASLADQVQKLRSDLNKSETHATALEAELESLLATQSETVTTARDRYDGLSKQLLQETAQQRQLAQQELGRLASQIKFAEKREATLQGRVDSLETELQEARSARDNANGEIAALRYVNTSMRAQLDAYMSARPAKSDPSALPSSQAKSNKRNVASVKGVAAKT